MKDILSHIRDSPGGVLDLGYHPRDNDFYRWEATASDGSSCAFKAFHDLDDADAILAECKARQDEGRPLGARPYTRWALVRSHFTVQLSIVREAE